MYCKSVYIYKLKKTAQVHNDNTIYFVNCYTYKRLLISKPLVLWDIILAKAIDQVFVDHTFVFITIIMFTKKVQTFLKIATVSVIYW